jgi:hypothetical protein
MLDPMHRHHLHAALFLLTSTVFTACGGERVDVPPGGPGSSGAPSATSTSSGDGGAPGDGGASGEGGSTAASTAEGGAGGSANGGGGQPSWDTCETPADCLGDEISICPENACESESIFFTCEGSEDAIPAYVACLSWSDLYRRNVWGRLVDCIRDATPEEHCDDGEAVVAACEAAARDDACDNPAAATTCAEAATACEDGDAFPVAECDADLVLWNSDALARYAQCIVETDEIACTGRHAACVAAIEDL